MKWFWAVLLSIGVATLLVISQPVQAQQQCDPSYPDICLAPPPPDLDCADIDFTSFRVLQPDPHHFDGDKDGIGCEPPRT